MSALSIVMLRTKLICTPKLLCRPEQSMQKNTPRLTDAQSTESLLPQSMQRSFPFSAMSLSSTRFASGVQDDMVPGKLQSPSPSDTSTAVAVWASLPAHERRRLPQLQPTGAVLCVQGSRPCSFPSLFLPHSFPFPRICQACFVTTPAENSKALLIKIIIRRDLSVFKPKFPCNDIWGTDSKRNMERAQGTLGSFHGSNSRSRIQE